MFWSAELTHLRALVILVTLEDVCVQLIKTWPLTIAPWFEHETFRMGSKFSGSMRIFKMKQDMAFIFPWWTVSHLFRIKMMRYILRFMFSSVWEFYFSRLEHFWERHMCEEEIKVPFADNRCRSWDTIFGFCKKKSHRPV